MNINIICVLKSGGIYDKKWVSRLKRNVKDFAPKNYKFICLSDVDVDCERINLKDNLSGWWSKIEIFRPNLFKGRVLYLDLDVLVVGDLKDLIFNSSRIISMKDSRFLGINSSVMCFNADENEIYKRFIYEQAIKKYRSDQNWINNLYPNLPTFDNNLVVSYKDQTFGNLPNNARIIVCHGKPKPNEIKEKWFLNIYEKYKPELVYG